MHSARTGGGSDPLPSAPLPHQQLPSTHPSMQPSMQPSTDTHTAQLWATAAATAAAAASAGPQHAATTSALASPFTSVTPRIPPAPASGLSAHGAPHQQTHSPHIGLVASTPPQGLYRHGSASLAPPPSEPSHLAPAASMPGRGHSHSHTADAPLRVSSTHTLAHQSSVYTSGLWGSESVVIEMPGQIVPEPVEGLGSRNTRSSRGNGSSGGADGAGRVSGSRRSTAPSAAIVGGTVAAAATAAAAAAAPAHTSGSGAGQTHRHRARTGSVAAATGGPTDGTAMKMAVGPAAAHQALQADNGCDGQAVDTPLPGRTRSATAAAAAAAAPGVSSALQRAVSEPAGGDAASLLPRTTSSGGGRRSGTARRGAHGEQGMAGWLQLLWPWGQKRESGAAGAGVRAKPAKAQPERLPSSVQRRLSRTFGQRVRHIHTWDQLAIWLVPEGKGRYPALWTLTYIVIAVSAYMFMAGQYPIFQLTELPMGSKKWVEAMQSLSYGPSLLLSWINPSMRGTPANSFAWQFLLTWGAKYNPSLAAGQWWRWVTSLLLHQNFNHIISNLTLFIVLSGIMEHEYGALRTFFIFIASGFSANFSSTIFEDACLLVVGASGAVFGLIGLFVADILINWETMMLPWFRLAGILGLLIFMVVMQVTDKTLAGNISYASHIGGGLTGLTAALLLLPNIKDKRFRALESLADRLGFMDQLQTMLRRTQLKGGRSGQEAQAEDASGARERLGQEGQQAASDNQQEGQGRGDEGVRVSGKDGDCGVVGDGAPQRWGSGDSLGGAVTRRTEEYVAVGVAGVAARAQHHQLQQGQRSEVIAAAVAPEQPSAPPLAASSAAHEGRAGAGVEFGVKEGWLLSKEVAGRAPSVADLKAGAMDQGRAATACAPAAVPAASASADDGGRVAAEAAVQGVVWVVDADTGIRMPQPCAQEVPSMRQATHGYGTDACHSHDGPEVPVVGGEGALLGGSLAGGVNLAGEETERRSSRQMDAVAEQVHAAGEQAGEEDATPAAGIGRRGSRRSHCSLRPSDDPSLPTEGGHEAGEAQLQLEGLATDVRLKGGSWWRRHTCGWATWILLASLSVLYLLLALLAQPLYIYYVVLPRVSCPY